jgi:hypothetical protein
MLKLSHGLVLIGWSRHFLTQKLQDGKLNSSSELAKDPCASFVGTDDVLFEVLNRKEGCYAWSLFATTSRILALSLTLL